MKKTFIALSMFSMMLLAASCGGNKTEATDSDSVVLEGIILEDTAVGEDTTAAVVEEVVETVEEPATRAAAPKKDNKTKKDNTTKKDNSTTNNTTTNPEAKPVNDKVNKAVDAAVKQTKEVVETGVSDAAEKAKAWKDKKKNKE